jgi:hypothetical protein
MCFTLQCLNARFFVFIIVDDKIVRIELEDWGNPKP